MFEVYVDWDQGSAPGRGNNWFIIDDVDVTSIDGRLFTLYLIDEDGLDCVLDVEVMEDGSLMVYELANDSAQFWRAVVLDEGEVVTDVPQVDTNEEYSGPYDTSRLAVVLITPQQDEDSELFGEGANRISDALDPRSES